VFPYYLKMNKLYSGEGRLNRSILLQINAIPDHNDGCYHLPVPIEIASTICFADSPLDVISEN
jgi:hypothetical protein